MKQSKRNVLNIDSYRFVKIPKRKQEFLFTILSLCKEIRATLYPIKGSSLCALQVEDFTAYADSDVTSITGSLTLIDGSLKEIRSFEAYIMEDVHDIKVYMDIERIGVLDEPKLIRTSESIVEKEDSYSITTKYSQGDFTEEKNFEEVVSKSVSYLSYFK